MDRADKAEAAVARVRELAEAVDQERQRSLSVTFGGSPFPALLDAADVLRALDGDTPAREDDDD